MTLARKYLIAPEDTPYYHVMSRCVRRAFLCGIDKYSGNNYEHRRGLIIGRVKFLASVFNIMIYIPVNPTTCRPVAFKFDPVKFSGTVQQLKNFVENIKQKIKADISLTPALE